MYYATYQQPFPRLAQVDDSDCLPTAIAMQAASQYGRDPDALAVQLRRRMRPQPNRGSTVDAGARALRALGIVAHVIRGESIYELAQHRCPRGGVVVGVDPGVIYDVPPGVVGHALVIGKVDVAMVPAGDPAWMYGDLTTPTIELIDPSPHAPSRHTYVTEIVAWAYDAAGRQALWLPYRR